MLRVEDHTADIKLVIDGDFCKIVEHLVGYVTNTNQCSDSREFFFIEIEEDAADLFFVNLVNILIAELEIRDVRPVCFKIEYCKEFKVKIKIYYNKGSWYNRIKAATYHNLKYQNGKLEIVLDI